MRAARPIAPRIASGVPAAMPHAPATMTTEIVERASRVTRNVNARAGEREVDEIAGEAIGGLLDRGARLLGVLDRLDDLAECGIAADPRRAHGERARSD